MPEDVPQGLAGRQFQQRILDVRGQGDAQRMGVETDKFGFSTGVLDINQS